MYSLSTVGESALDEEIRIIPVSYCGEVHIAMDICENGSFYDLITRKGPLPENIAMYYFNQLCSIVNYCHSLGIYHRDIKLENMMIDSRYQLKLIDFGLAHIGVPFTKTTLSLICGTPLYMAPELVANHTYFGDKVDSWVVGVVYFIFLTGIPPFTIANRDDFIFNQLCQDWSLFWSYHSNSKTLDISKSTKNILKGLLTVSDLYRMKVGKCINYSKIIIYIKRFYFYNDIK
jgi:serine/threonine protein kinase